MPDSTNTTASNKTISIGENGGMFSISETAFEEFAFASNIFVTPLVCLFGIIGNSLSFGALCKDTKRQKLSIYIYLCGLTFFDIFYLSFGLLKSIPDYIKLFEKEFASYLDAHLQLGFVYIDVVLSHTSNAIIIVMSLERLLALVRPFTVKDSLFSRYPKHLVCVCFVVNVIVLIPYAISFETDSYIVGNATEYYFRYKSDAAADMETYVFIQTIVHYVIPPVLVFFINTSIPIVYYRAMNRRRAVIEMEVYGSPNSQQTKITATVFYITLMYCLLSLPKTFIFVVAFFDKDYSFVGKYNLAFWLFIDIGNLFSYINAANDFIIYVLVSKQSRQTFTDMYCRRKCCWRHEDNSNVYMTNSEEIRSSDRPMPLAERY